MFRLRCSCQIGSIKHHMACLNFTRDLFVQWSLMLCHDCVRLSRTVIGCHVHCFNVSTSLEKKAVIIVQICISFNHLGWGQAHYYHQSLWIFYLKPWCIHIQYLLVFMQRLNITWYCKKLVEWPFRLRSGVWVRVRRIHSGRSLPGESPSGVASSNNF